MSGLGEQLQQATYAVLPLFPVIGFKKLRAEAIPPTKGSYLAAGFDIHTPIGFEIPARGSFLVPTYLAFSLPAGTYGRLSTRSSMAIQGIDVCAGVIDADYTGEVKVLLHNRSPNLYRALRGDRIAQIIATRIDYPLLYEINELNETRRGAEGFGSSGI